MQRKRTSVLTAALLTFLVASAGAFQAVGAARHTQPASTVPAARAGVSAQTHHYLYVFPEQAMYVYDIDQRHRLIAKATLPGITSIRGGVASVRTHMLYISHGGDGGSNGNGSLLKYDLVAGRSVWDRSYSFGIDVPAVSADGSRIYMPDGALSPDGRWEVLDAGSGKVLGQIQGGAGPHDTVLGLSGRSVYLGGRSWPYLEVASTSTDRVVRRVGPLRSGVRPFTINGRETLAYTSSTGLLGFQASSIATGRVLYTVRPSGFSWDPSKQPYDDPSHGISLSPDERQLWLIDSPNGYLHVWGLAGMPAHAPRPTINIKIADPASGTESGCTYACTREGWLLHSRSGCFVYVGDSGDVYSTATFRKVAYLVPLRNTRHLMEIDWRGGVPVSTTSQFGLGYATGARVLPSPKCPH